MCGLTASTIFKNPGECLAMARVPPCECDLRGIVRAAAAMPRSVGRCCGGRLHFLASERNSRGVGTALRIRAVETVGSAHPTALERDSPRGDCVGWARPNQLITATEWTARTLRRL